MINYGRQNINSKDIKNVVKTLSSNWLTSGPKIHEFEKKISAFTNSKYAIAVNNETSALRCALNALDLQPGNEVIVTSIGSINISLKSSLMSLSLSLFIIYYPFFY